MVVVAAVNDRSAAGAGRPLGAAGRIAVAGRGEDHGTMQSAEGVNQAAIEPQREGWPEHQTGAGGSGYSMETEGLEPSTPALQTRCSAN